MFLGVDVRVCVDDGSTSGGPKRPAYVASHRLPADSAV